MSIREVTDTDVVQQCGHCGASTRVQIDALEVGVARDDQTDASVVPLPACPTCRSTEFLLRSPEDEPPHPAPGSFGHLHRLLVDEVHAALVKRKKVIPLLKDKQGRVDPKLAKPVAAEELARWFPRGLKIEPRVAEAVRAKEPGQ
ncbi:hypothetical protein [Corallococcus sp. EGB]|uniref:hypothetical protein n=1 Tax=Corallococcus sp. EGB TaxID=1521117 RepID=UPI001CC11ADB|nr:hypothetical protein [Corallococcus sp. EGB]